MADSEKSYHEMMKAARAAYEITQTQLGDFVGCCERTIRRMEKCEHIPTRREAEIIAETLRINFKSFWEACMRARGV